MNQLAGHRPFLPHVWLAIALSAVAARATADDGLRDEATAAMHRAVEFFSTQVASHGGYVYRYSDDLRKREGEGATVIDTVWVQPPGTPAVGLAYVEAYERTRDPRLLAAARATGECLVRGQLRSGGWQDRIEFGSEQRGKLAYRVEPERPKARNWSTFDDNKTQAALRMLTRLDAALEFKDERIHESITFALTAVLRAQFPHGGWAQVFDGTRPDPARHPVKAASFPESWSREFPGGDYWLWYTFNDHAISDTIEALLLADHVYGAARYREAALKAGEFILLAQLPEPQPAWAQQYDFAMQPAWARRFEPPAVSGGESQRLVETLFRLYIETGDQKFLAPAPRVLAYFDRSKLADGRLARFYELRTNKPLYFTKDYRLTDDDGDLPTHYGFKIDNKSASLRKRYEELRQLSADQLAARRDSNYWLPSGRPSDGEIRGLIRSLDERGAWVEDGRLQYHGKQDDTRRIISSLTFARNLDAISRYLARQ